jgi:hypothetical protein
VRQRRSRRPRRNERPREEAPLPPERLAEQPFVWDPFTSRLVAPWPRGTPLTVEEQHQLLALMARIDALRLEGVVWVWPDPARKPVPVSADNAVQWADRWGAERASYVRR